MVLMNDFKYEVKTNIDHTNILGIRELKSWLYENIGEAYVQWMTFSSAKDSDDPVRPVKFVKVKSIEHATAVKLRWG